MIIFVVRRDDEVNIKVVRKEDKCFRNDSRLVLIELGSDFF